MNVVMVHAVFWHLARVAWAGAARGKGLELMGKKGCFLAELVFLGGLLVWAVWVCNLRAEPADARQILEATGVKGGLVVHVGCGDGRLTAELGAEQCYLVHALERDAAKVEQARDHIRSMGLYGRVSVERWAGQRLPYIENLVNLVVWEEPGEVPMDEVMRVLCPNGVAYVKTDGGWVKTVKPRPAEIDEWTHYLHDASNNAVAHDTVIGPPRRFQWLGSPRWSRHHDRMASTSACVSADGRIFYIIDEGSRACIQLPSKWMLVARDAFNGTILWKQPLAGWVTQLWPFKSGPALPPRRLVAVGQRVYVTLGLDGAPLSTLDAATGQVIRTHAETMMTEEIIHSEAVLFVVVKDMPATTGWNEYRPIHRTIGKAKTRVADEYPWDEGQRWIVAIDAETGQEIWRVRHPVAPLSLAADSEGVYFHDGERILRLDRFTGRQLWQSEPIDRWASMPTKFGPTLVVYDDVILFEGGDPNKSLTAVSKQDGRTLWASNHPATGHNCPYDLLVIDGLAWVGAIAGGKDSGIFTGWDVHTGQVVKEFAPDVDTYWFHHRCYRSKATDKYILCSRTGIEFVDVRSQTWTTNHWVRGGCLYGVMPCNGLIYNPPHNCACYFEAKQYGFNALAPAYPHGQYPSTAPDDQRLEPGPAYGSAAGDPPGEEDWPTFRCDTTRSGFLPTIVPADLKMQWSRQLGGRLSSLTVANGSLYVASTDEHMVYALDEGTGQVLWTFTAGGRVDSPPTIYNGRVLFGCADGRVYCLDASDGELVWRFAAAPDDLRMTSFEQVESVWPVHGSVLVENGMVYCVAGRSMFLDGGLRFLRLDPMTGQKISEKILDDRDPNSGENLQIHVKRLNMPVALPDILSSDGQYVYMHSQRFDLQGNRLAIPPYSGDHNEQGRQQYGVGMHLFSPTGFLDGSYMHRTYWVFGRSWASGAGGYHRAGAYAPAGRMMVFDENRIFGFGRQRQYYKWSTPLEYELFCVEKYPASRSIEYHWSKPSPGILVRAMVLADKTLFVAGPADVVDEEAAFDYWSADPNDPNTDANIPAKLVLQEEALEGRLGGVLWAVWTADGNETARYQLESPPVWDGMVAANGRLYVSLENGVVKCLAGRNYPPVVDAGQDRVIYPRARLELDAVISDDGLPVVDPCDPCSVPVGVTVQWSKLAGPGEVEFADPCSARTSASFSQWGRYELRVTTFDGAVSYYDDLSVRVCRPGDLDQDGDVDIFDLDLLAGQWLKNDCGQLNEWCGGADQTAGGDVALDDYTITAGSWLAGVYPAAPAEVAASGGDYVVRLDWADNAETDLAGYNVYRSLLPGSDYVRINDSLLTDSQYDDSSAVNCVTYFYAVTAVDRFGYESPYSQVVAGSAGPQAGIKLVAGIGVTASGLEIRRWNDLAQNNDARQDSPEARPFLVTEAINGLPAIDFNGPGRHLDVPDSDQINTGGPYSGKTIAVVFKTSTDIASRQIIWEQGGGTRGLNVYIDGGKVYVNGWNLKDTEPQWGPTGLSTEISADSAYLVTLVLDGAGGTFTGILNGRVFGAAGGAGLLYSHSDDCALGHREGGTKFHDGTNAGPADFTGQVAEFHEYNQALATSDRLLLEAALMAKYAITPSETKDE